MVSKKVTFISDESVTQIGVIDLGWEGGLAEEFGDSIQAARSHCGQACLMAFKDQSQHGLLTLTCRSQKFDTEAETTAFEERCEEAQGIAARGIRNYIDFVTSQEAQDWTV